ncbi:hypothetical protein EDD11_009271 [Mortierella claussenii]|nr:hypothetical protein EDD11_009271 [Mortierella claussenii]
MVNTAVSSGIQLDDETRNQEIVASLRGFLKHQTAFKEYTAKRMTPEEYATICNIVTEGFVELSIEILALEAHLGGSAHSTTPASTSTSALSSPPPAVVVSTAQESTDPSSEIPAATSPSSPGISLNSPEHAQLIRQVQLLEKQKLALTVQGQKWVLEKEAQEAQDEKDRELELQADRIITSTEEQTVEEGEAGVRVTVVHNETPTTTTSTIGIGAANQQVSTASPQMNGNGAGAIKLSVQEWEDKLEENRNRLNEVVEEINDKLADIQEAIAILVL